MYGMDVFYISYDEPQKEEFWENISHRIPHAQRIDGVKGFHQAHKKCAELSKTPRFFTVDGDTLLADKFWDLNIPQNLLESQYVLSWSSRNSLNCLSYGNGGVKNWPREALLNSNTHEASTDERSSVDFCFSLQYYQMPEELSSSHMTYTPFQAFRAGFREGIKMALAGGLKITDSPIKSALHQKIHVSNIERLKIWCSIGSDAQNGLWAIYGARKGLSYLYLENQDHSLIRDYQWFENFWKTAIQTQVNEANIVDHIQALGDKINLEMGLGLTLLTAKDSQFFKSVYVNRTREPQLLRWD